MKNLQKVLLILLCVAAIVATTIMGTLAWLTDKSSVTNTMTAGKVDITVDEEKVDLNGDPIPGEDRVTENEYLLIPGQTYTKDPTMTVLADSEESYVRMLLTLNCKAELDAIFAPDGIELYEIFKDYDPACWIFETETTENNTVTYEFRYKETVDPDGSDVVLEPLFTEFFVPGTVTGEDLESIEGLTITVVGHAIQKLGFDSADDAWAAFDDQMNP